MNKDAWDKLGILATFLQIVVIGGFTAAVSFYTSRMTNKLETYKTGMDESNMIKTLVTELTADTASKVRTDFALLSLERYLKSSQNGTLQAYDQEMLVGFAQSIIWDRVEKGKVDSTDLNEILIPNDFLKKYDSTRQGQILNDIARNQKRKKLPLEVRSDSLQKIEPVQQAVHNNTQVLSALFNKTCYIQYASDIGRDKAKEYQKKLQSAKWYAPGIDYVAGNYRNTIKYFHPEDSELANALKNTLQISGFETVYTRGFEPKTPKGQLEIWIGE